MHGAHDKSWLLTTALEWEPSTGPRGRHSAAWGLVATSVGAAAQVYVAERHSVCLESPDPAFPSLPATQNGATCVHRGMAAVRVKGE